MEWIRLPEILRPLRVKLLLLSSIVGIGSLIYITSRLFKRRNRGIQEACDDKSPDDNELVGNVPFSYIRDELARKRSKPLKVDKMYLSRKIPTETKSLRIRSNPEDMNTRPEDPNTRPEDLNTRSDSMNTRPEEQEIMNPVSFTVSDLDDLSIGDDIQIQKAVVDLNCAINQLEDSLGTVCSFQGVSTHGLRSSKSIATEINRLKDILHQASELKENNIINDFVEEDHIDDSYEPQTFELDPTIERQFIERIKDDEDDDDDDDSTCSDDSFVSASGEISLEFGYDNERSQSSIALDIMIMDLVNRNSNLDLYMMGIEYFTQYGIPVRKLRTQMLECENDVDFCVKVHCIRKAFEVVLRTKSTRKWFIQSGKELVSKFLQKANKDYLGFQTEFDAVISFCENADNWSLIEEELAGRQVCCMSFYDIICDFIIMDAFTDLQNPPYAVTTVTQNRWLSTSIKETALTTTVWSLLMAKTRMLKYPDGFMAHFYKVSQHMTPVLVWGFLGPVDELRDICMSFKSTLLGFMQDIFSVDKVNFNSTKKLAEDIIRIAQTKKREADDKLL